VRLLSLDISKHLKRPISLRTLMVLIALVACWLGWETNRARTQEQAITIITRAGGAFDYDDVVDGEGEVLDHRARPAWQLSLMWMLGPDYLRRPRWLRGPVRWRIRGEQSRPQAIEQIWKAISDLPDIVRVQLESADNEDVMRLRKLTGVKILWIRFRNLSDASKAQLGEMQQLRSLDIGNTDFDDAGLVHVGRLTRLRELRLSRTLITDAGLAHLRGLHNLETLYLDRTRITDAGLAQLAALGGLRKLDLSGTSISDAGLPHLKQLPRLETLTVPSGVSSRAIEDLKLVTPAIEIGFY
jgi:Leucine rich repeat